MKKLIFLTLTLISCERVQDHTCACYENLGTDSVSYELYHFKNKQTMAESYCKSLSMPQKPCNLSE